MKRTLVFCLLTCLLLLMTSCGNNAPEAPYQDVTSENGASSYLIGDIVLADGSVQTAFSAVDADNMPIAVIAGYREDGTAIGLGVHRSDRPLPWAAEDTFGYTTNFSDNVCTQVSEWDFSGDWDGSDNWETICAQDKPGTVVTAENYPAFQFVNTYAETYHLAGDFASGWYIPSIAELCAIYQNREAVNRSLQKIYETDPAAAMDGLDTNWYWSSSQAGSADDYAWFVHFFTGYAGECPKNFTNVHALAVRKF